MGEILEPVLDAEGVSHQEFDTLDKANSEAKSRLGGEDVQGTKVIEKRMVAEFTNPEGDEFAAPAGPSYQVGKSAEDLLIKATPDFADVHCPCGGKTAVTIQGVKDAGVDGTIAKCVRCSRHFKLVIEAGAVRAWNVELV